MTGIYFLIHRKRVVYIGATNRYPARVKQHPDKIFTSHRFIECGQSSLAYYEKRWIARFKPKYNKNNGANKVHKALVEPSEKVILVGFYTKKHVIDSIGGMDEVRTKAKEYIEGHAIGNEIGGIV